MPLLRNFKPGRIHSGDLCVLSELVTYWHPKGPAVRGDISIARYLETKTYSSASMANRPRVSMELAHFQYYYTIPVKDYGSTLVLEVAQGDIRDGTVFHSWTSLQSTSGIVNGTLNTEDLLEMRDFLKQIFPLIRDCYWRQWRAYANSVTVK